MRCEQLTLRCRARRVEGTCATSEQRGRVALSAPLADRRYGQTCRLPHDRSRQLARLPRDWSGLGKFQGGRRVPIKQVRIAGLPVRRLALRDSIDCRSQLSSRCGVGTPPRSNRGPAAVQQLLPSLLAALASSAVVNVDRLLLEDGGPFAIGASAEPGAHLGCRSLMTFVRCSWAG